VSGRNRPDRLAQARRLHDDQTPVNPAWVGAERRMLRHQVSFEALLKGLRVHAPDLTDSQRVGIATDVAYKGGQLRTFDIRAEAVACIWECLLEWKETEPNILAALWEEKGTVEMRHKAISLAEFVLDVWDGLGGDAAIDDLDLIPYDWQFVPAVLRLVDWTEGGKPPTVEAAVKALRERKR